ncbi:MAG: response regulator [Pseudomonadota bacterium]
MQNALPKQSVEEAETEYCEDLSILVLDDDDFDRERLRRMSQRAGFHALIRETASLPEFKRALDERRYDIAIIDYRLPEGSGIEAVRLKNEHPDHANTATIMIAGDAPTEVAVEAMKAGFDDYLSKAQLSPQVIRQAIFGALERSSLNRSDTDERDLRDATYKVLKAVSNACFNDMRPILSRMLRKVRLMKNHSGNSRIDETAILGDLDTSCMRLCDFIDELDQYANSWKSKLH